MPKMPSLKIGELIAKVPIIQGGMSVGISMSGLAAAVANEGGIGVIGAAGIGFLEQGFDDHPFQSNMDALKNEIRKAREMTNGIIGVNVMKALTDYDNLVKVSIKEKVDAIFIGAGLPLRIPGKLDLSEFKKMKTKIITIVSSASAVKTLFTYWEKNYNKLPDAVVVEGPEAGGHLGFTENDLIDGSVNLMDIVNQVKETVREFTKRMKISIPIIAAGGIFSGKDIFNTMKNGADGVQMATRFVATNECDASDEFKQEYIDAKEEDIVIIKSPVGLPGRAIKNEFLKSVSDGTGGDTFCSWKCLRTCRMSKAQYCIGRALANAKIGLLKEGFAFAGTNAFRVNKIMTVKELIELLMKEYAEAENGE